MADFDYIKFIATKSIWRVLPLCRDAVQIWLKTLFNFTSPFLSDRAHRRITIVVVGLVGRVAFQTQNWKPVRLCVDIHFTMCRHVLAKPAYRHTQSSALL